MEDVYTAVHTMEDVYTAVYHVHCLVTHNPFC
jgi:hypothetical protein